jgi:hypothetical protein
MSVRPKDLSKDSAAWCVLNCGDCVVDYPATPEAYDWMFPEDDIVCAGCGGELALEEQTLVEA